MKEITSVAIAEIDPQQIEFAHRPRISAKIRNYLIVLIRDKILIPKKVIVNDKHVYRITFGLRPNIDSSRPDRVQWDVKTILGKKVINISIYYVSVTKDMTPREYTNVLFDGLKAFLTEQYKKITPEEMETVRQKIDWDYIESLPFPAPFAEQDYILDANPNVQMAYHQQFGD